MRMSDPSHRDRGHREPLTAAPREISEAALRFFPALAEPRLSPGSLPTARARADSVGTEFLNPAAARAERQVEWPEEPQPRRVEETATACSLARVEPAQPGEEAVGEQRLSVPVKAPSSAPAAAVART